MIQSLLTQAEYDYYSKIYKTYNPTYRRGRAPIRSVTVEGRIFVVGPPPNWIMGNSLKPSEIETFNNSFNSLLKDVHRAIPIKNNEPEGVQ